ncbi:MAG: 16S rRNA (guanine(966)-N(2))-methyltransferase RsmD [Myxococcota bacterium]
MLRITGGDLRGRRFRAPKGSDTRPTSDMVRQALFNLLGQELGGEHVLDVYCGSGALGLEALSRGAATAWLVDKSRQVCELVRQNAAELGLSARVTVVCSDAVKALRSLPAGGASLAFCDPPYALQDRSALLDALAHAVHPGGTLVFETAEEDEGLHPPEAWEPTDTRVYGGTRLHLLRRR